MKRIRKTICGIACAAALLASFPVSVFAQDNAEVIISDADFEWGNPSYMSRMGNDVYYFVSDNGTSFCLIDDTVLENWRETGEFDLTEIKTDEMTGEIASKGRFDVISHGIDSNGNVSFYYYDYSDEKISDVILKYDDGSLSFVNKIIREKTSVHSFKDGKYLISEWVEIDKEKDIWNLRCSIYENEDFFEPVKTVDFKDCLYYSGGPGAEWYYGLVRMPDGTCSIQSIDSDGTIRNLKKNLDDVRMLDSYEDVLVFNGKDCSDGERYTWIYDISTGKLYKISEKKLDKFTCDGKVYVSQNVSYFNNGMIAVNYVCDDDYSIKSMMYDVNKREFISKACEGPLGSNPGKRPNLYCVSDGRYSYFTADGERCGVWFDDACDFNGDRTLARNGDEIFFIDTEMNVVSEKVKLDEKYMLYSAGSDVYFACFENEMKLITIK